MSESVSGVDTILAGLRRRWTYPRDLPDATQVVPLADAEAVAGLLATATNEPKEKP